MKIVACGQFRFVCFPIGEIWLMTIHVYFSRTSVFLCIHIFLHYVNQTLSYSTLFLVSELQKQIIKEVDGLIWNLLRNRWITSLFQTCFKRKKPQMLRTCNSKKNIQHAGWSIKKMLRNSRPFSPTSSQFIKEKGISNIYTKNIHNDF